MIKKKILISNKIFQQSKYTSHNYRVICRYSFLNPNFNINYFFLKIVIICVVHNSPVQGCPRPDDCKQR